MISDILAQEVLRQQHEISLIPSENHPSLAVRQAVSSVFMGKYAEGYPGKRYYAGNRFADELELQVQALAQQVFHTDYLVNVQAHSGSPANMAVYSALLQPGDTILGLKLDHGGHLTHGHGVSLTGKLWKAVHYQVQPDTELVSLEEVAKLAREHQPKLIICGATAYPAQIDFAGFAAIAKEVGAYLLADISHISGLVAAGVHPSPFGHADVVTTTTHKVMRGPRGALIFAKPELMPAINKALFPGMQGGPHLNTIAGIGVALEEMLLPSYQEYAEQVVLMAKAMAARFTQHGFKVLTGGTEVHQLLLDLRGQKILGKEAQELLESVGLITNKNGIPFDPNPPTKPSGLRLGTPAIASRGMGVAEAEHLADLIAETIGGATDLTLIADQVRTLAARFPTP